MTFLRYDTILNNAYLPVDADSGYIKAAMVDLSGSSILPVYVSGSSILTMPGTIAVYISGSERLPMYISGSEIISVNPNTTGTNRVAVYISGSEILTVNPNTTGTNRVAVYVSGSEIISVNPNTTGTNRVATYISGSEVLTVNTTGTNRVAVYISGSEETYLFNQKAGPTALVTASEFTVLTASYQDVGTEVSMVGYKYASYFVNLDISSSLDVRFKVLAKHTSAGINEYELDDSAVKITTPNTYYGLSGSVSVRAFELNSNIDQDFVIKVQTDNNIPYLQLMATAISQSSTTPGRIESCYVVKSF